MTRHLLSCPNCGLQIAVTAGQAGDRVTCGGCGTDVAVPRLGDLARLPRSDAMPATSRPRSSWTAGHACLWSGLVIAGLSSVAALALQSPPGPAVDEDRIRTAFRAGSIVDVYQIWQGLERVGVARPPTDAEQDVLLRTRARGGIARVVWLAAAAGGVLAAVGATAMAARRRGTAGATVP
jgi:hypothetical protein